MLRRGDEFGNPAAGMWLVVRETGAENGGALLALEATYAPHGHPPPAHLHPGQEERFTVLAGALRVRVAGEERILRTGDVLTIPPGVAHAMWNDSAEAARLRWETRPALRTLDFLATLAGLAREGRVNGRGVPRPLQLALLLHSYRREFRPAGLPAGAVRIAAGLLAPLARLCGYRAGYARYGAGAGD